MPDPDRIVTVSTIEDPPDRVDRFVRRTLTTGVDHMIVFLDSEQARLPAELDEHPQVTLVQAGADYWRGERPSARTDRHLVNANVACAALAAADSVKWLFPLACDEALVFDRAGLLAVTAPSVAFPAREAVAKRRWRHGDPKLFKKVPTAAELHALAGLGRIPAPELRWVFRGPSLGATGVRPGGEVRFGRRGAYRTPDLALEAAELPGAHLLRYADCTIAEFTEHWALVDPAEEIALSEMDRRLAAAFAAVAKSPHLDDAERRARIGELFDRFIADDVRSLRQFALVVRRPRQQATEARSLPGTEATRIESALEHLHHTDKDEFRSPAEDQAGMHRSAS